MTPALRRAIGALALLIYLPVYIAIAASVGGLLAGAPGWAKLLYFAAAGFVWVAPLYPLFVWMRGRRDQGTRATLVLRRGRE